MWQPAGCVSCELVCVCVLLVRVVIIIPASTHTALVSSPSLTVVHLSTYIHWRDAIHGGVSGKMTALFIYYNTGRNGGRRASQRPCKGNSFPPCVCCFVSASAAPGHAFLFLFDSGRPAAFLS